MSVVKVTFPPEFQTNARMQDNKQLIGAYAVIRAATTAAMKTLVTVRVWTGLRSNAQVHACVWIESDEGLHFSGYGRASGYGYDKMGSAVRAALKSAGIMVEEAEGECDVDELLMEVAKAIGKPTNKLDYSYKLVRFTN